MKYRFSKEKNLRRKIKIFAIGYNEVNQTIAEFSNIFGPHIPVENYWDFLLLSLETFTS